MTTIRHFLETMLIVCALSFAFTTTTRAQTAPPAAPVREVTDNYFGQKIVDPYRWMEDNKSDEMQSWMKAQATFAQTYLQALPGQNRLLKRLNEVSSASISVANIRQRGKRFFYERRAPDEQDFKLYVREGLTGVERLLIDPNKVLNDGKRYSLNDWQISFDGRHVSYLISAGGSETGEIHVVDVVSGKNTSDRIDRARFGAGSWLPDGKSIFYTRLQKLTENAPSADRYQKSRVYRHVLGTDAESDEAIFGFDVNPNIAFDQKLIPFITTDPSWNVAVAYLSTGVSPSREFFVAPLDAMSKKQIPWRKIIAFDDEVGSVAIYGSNLYLQTYKNTPRYKIVRTSLSTPDLPNAETVFSPGDAVVTSLSAQLDALYVQTLDGGNIRIWRVDYKTKKSVPLKLPFEGAASLTDNESSAAGIYFELVSWTRPRAHFRYDPNSGIVVPTHLVPPDPVDMSGIEFINIKVKSYDGAMIPLVIIYKKGLKRDGTNPTLMAGYGAYGVEYTSPVFDTQSLPWLERGGVMVWAGIRGGGEYGEEWHQAGFQKTKPNTWKDFIACAEYLIAEKYTSPAHLAIRGGSAGGILISNAIAERPELFGAAINNVGINDTLRYETTSNGVPNIQEFGSTTTEEGFKTLLAMDGYLKIKKGVKYPAVLLTTGINDPRVEPWMSAKMAAQLQAASSSGKPVLLSVDYDAGHGRGSTKEQRNKQLADEYAFLFEQVGSPGAKPGNTNENR